MTYTVQGQVFEGPDFNMGEGAPTVIEYRGAFYINMGLPGFNSFTNNTCGYETAKQAEEVIAGKRSRFK